MSATARAAWLADGLRWIGGLCEALARRLERESAPGEVPGPAAWRDLLPPHERVFELRTRIHCGDY